MKKSGNGVSLLALCLGLGFVAAVGERALAALEPQQLQLNQAFVARSISGGEAHLYSFAGLAGQFAQVVLTQRGIDLVVAIESPQGKVLVQVDRPNSLYGPETISVILPVDGIFITRITSLQRSARTASYDIFLAQLRSPEPLDGSRILAQEAITSGEALRAKGDGESLRASVDQFQRALIEWELLNDRYELAVALYGLGLAQRSLGESQMAVGTFSRSLKLFRELDDRYGSAMAQTGLGWAYHHVGELPMAIAQFSESLTLRLELKDPQGEALTLFGLASAFAHNQQDDKAVEFFSRSLELRRALADRRGEALCLIGIGKLRLHRGELNAARDALEQGRFLLRESGHTAGEGDALSHLAWVYRSMNEGDEAAELLNRAVHLSTAAGDLAGEALIRYRLAVVERDANRLGAAWEQIQKTLSIVERLRSRGQDPEMKAAFVSNVKAYYEFGTDLLIRMHQERPDRQYVVAAIEMSEQSLARNLLDALSEARAESDSVIPAALLAKREALLNELQDAFTRLRIPRSSSTGGAELAQKVQRTRALLYEVDRDIRQLRRRASNDDFSSVPLKMSEIQREVDDQSLLLKYALGTERSFLWAISAEEIKTFVLPARAGLEAEAEQFQRLINARNTNQDKETSAARRARIEAADKAVLLTGRSIGRSLLGPVAGILGNKRLILVVEGKLQLIPFAALHDPASPTGTYQPLVLKHHILYAPSASTFASLKRSRGSRGSAQTIGIIADPVTSEEDERFVRISSRQPAPKGGNPTQPPFLPRLYASAWEADRIASHFSSSDVRTWRGFEASRDILTEDLSSFRILHFASHAIVNHEHPEISAIALSQIAPTGQRRPGLVYAHEILSLRLRADFIVLSGCQTSLGKDLSGEGMTGLTRSFLHAGASAVISSLWPVKDSDSADFMAKFYRNLMSSSHQTSVSALNETQRQLSASGARRPSYFWAAYSVLGN